MWPRLQPRIRTGNGDGSLRRRDEAEGMGGGEGAADVIRGNCRGHIGAAVYAIEGPALSLSKGQNEPLMPAVQSDPP